LTKIAITLGASKQRDLLRLSKGRLHRRCLNENGFLSFDDIQLICSPKTVPPRVRLLWDNHNSRGGLFHEEFTLQSGAGSLCHEARQAESGTPVSEVCRKMGITDQTFYRWKKKYAGMGVAEVRKLRILEEENRKLKQLVADLSLDKQMLQDVLRKKA
jgi:putative transposase